MMTLNNSFAVFSRMRVATLAWAVRQARQSPSRFAEFAFTDADHRRLRQAAVHEELQEFLTRHDRSLIELPRDHGKSMQICVRVLWELGWQPSLRVKIVCASEALAAERSRFLRDAILRNDRVRMTFPGLRLASPWTATRFTIRRPADVIGPSVTALGVNAASTGTRADLLVCDDIVDVKSIRSAAERERVKMVFRENLVNLLEPTGRLWNIFTPWHRNDLNAELKENAVYPLFRRAIGDNLEPVWPEKWPRERLAEREKEIGAVPFARAYRLICVPDAAVIIPIGSVQFWEAPAQYDLTVLAVDPAVSTRPSADFSALVMLGRTEKKQVHCLEAIAERVATPDLLRLIEQADRRWNPDLILFESQAAFKGLLELMQQQCSFGGKLMGVTQSTDKEWRARLFSVHVEKGNFRLKGENGRAAPAQQVLFDQMTTFPLGEHDDLLDAAAFGTAFLLNQREPKVHLFDSREALTPPAD